LPSEKKNDNIDKMKRIIFLIIFNLLLILAMGMHGANRFVEKAFFSQAMEKDMTYYVSYPDGYDEDDATKKFPVIIFLHGASVNAATAVQQIEPFITNPFTQSIFKNLFKVIFVVPDGSAEPFLGSFYTNSALYGNYEDYISEDLVNELSENYKTYDEREKWAIMGHSMGGYGCMKIALKNPEDYVGVAALSAPLHITHYENILPLLLEEHGDAPPYEYTYQGDVTKLIYSMAGAFSPAPDEWPPVVFPVDTMGNIKEEVTEQWEAHNPINLIDGWQGEPKLEMYIYCGELDEYQLLSQNELFSDSLNHYGIEHTFNIDPYGDHIASLITSLPEGLNFLYEAMTENDPNSVGTIPDQKFSVFPNPATDCIVFNNRNGVNVNSAIIYSLNGIAIKRFSTRHCSNGKLNIEDLLPGCYILQLNTNNNLKHRLKIVKK
jgi:S-formylglutathione hydrolase FrmB